MEVLTENFAYHHKKFGQRWRSQDEDIIRVDADVDLKTGPVPTKRPRECDARDSPQTISSDSNNSCDFVSFTQDLPRHSRDSSTPLLKRRKEMREGTSVYEDSGISLTTQRQQEDTVSLSSSFDSTCFGATSFKHRIYTPKPVITTATSKLVPNPAALLPKINDETLHNICKYHGNMVRKFPKKERTYKDQERRNKNTIACRMSRRVKKLEHIAVEEQYKECYQQHLQIAEESIRATAYFNELMRLMAARNNENYENDEQSLDLTKLKAEPQQQPQKQGPTTSKCQTVPKKRKPFSIAFLVGK